MNTDERRNCQHGKLKPAADVRSTCKNAETACLRARLISPKFQPLSHVDTFVDNELRRFDDHYVVM